MTPGWARTQPDPLHHLGFPVRSSRLESAAGGLFHAPAASWRFPSRELGWVAYEAVGRGLTTTVWCHWMRVESLESASPGIWWASAPGQVGGRRRQAHWRTGSEWRRGGGGGWPERV